MDISQLLHNAQIIGTVAFTVASIGTLFQYHGILGRQGGLLRRLIVAAPTSTLYGVIYYYEDALLVHRYFSKLVTTIFQIQTSSLTLALGGGIFTFVFFFLNPRFDVDMQTRNEYIRTHHAFDGKDRIIPGIESKSIGGSLLLMLISCPLYIFMFYVTFHLFAYFFHVTLLKNNIIALIASSVLFILLLPGQWVISRGLRFKVLPAYLFVMGLFAWIALVALVIPTGVAFFLSIGIGNFLAFLIPGIILQLLIFGIQYWSTIIKNQQLEVISLTLTVIGIAIGGYAIFLRFQ